MSLERKPTAPSSAEQSSPDAAAPPRTLKPASNPAQRLQELLRREAQQSREAEQCREAQQSREAVQPAVQEEPSPGPAPQPIVIPALPTPTPAPVPPVPPVTATPKKESVTLIVIVNSERSTPTEYPSMDDLPTVTSLEETHGAFLLSDEWQRRGPTLTRIVRLRRRQRRR